MAINFESSNIQFGNQNIKIATDSAFTSNNGVRVTDDAAITTGMVSYIVIFELFPHLVEHQKEKGTVLGVLVGVVILMISVMLGHHH